MEKLDIDELAKDPGQLRQYFGNGGAEIVDSEGRVVAEVPPAIEPLVEDDHLPTIADSDWLD